MIFPKTNKSEVPKQEPMIVPLAMPIIAGPGGITTVMVFAEQLQNPWMMTSAILIAWIPTLALLLVASNIKLFLGEKGLTACERLGGMLICLISVQMFTSGTISLIHTSFLKI
jgi:multiple antibiotic resistance protein